MSTATPATAIQAADIAREQQAPKKARRGIKSFYPTWFFIPALAHVCNIYDLISDDKSLVFVCPGQFRDADASL